MGGNKEMREEARRVEETTKETGDKERGREGSRK